MAKVLEHTIYSRVSITDDLINDTLFEWQGFVKEKAVEAAMSLVKRRAFRKWTPPALHVTHFGTKLERDEEYGGYSVHTFTRLGLGVG